MHTVAECKERAEECRRLAGLGTDRRDWGHFEEMAQTWDMLAKQKQETLRLKTAALGDRFRDVLFLSVPAAKTAAIHSHEKAPEPFSLFRAADELSKGLSPTGAETW
jgi:hypothetical protein